MNHATLLVIIPDRLSDLVAKGEITARYYNPGNLFDEVHILMTNDDQPDAAALQKTVGSAQLHLHTYPRPNFWRTLGWRPWLLKGWAQPAIDLARAIRPALIRCHGNDFNAYLASQIKLALGIPFLVSLHINPDEDTRGRAYPIKQRVALNAMQSVERYNLHHADMALPVYQPIIPYLQRMGVKRMQVAYNVLNPLHLRKKEDYTLHHPVRVISVGRQFKEKNPEQLIRAISTLPDVQLTLVGDGEYHEHLQRTAAACQVQERVIFHRALPNDELCQQLPTYDLFATHTEYWEISKSVLEPLLTGLPVILNRRIGRPVPELQGDFVMLVENSTEGYARALKLLIQNHALREYLGRTAYAHAQEHWAPARTEQVFVDIYQSYVRG